MAITWLNDCTDGDDGQNMICEVIQQATDELYSQNETIISNQGTLQTNVQSNGTLLAGGIEDVLFQGDSLVDNANHISFYLFLAIVLSCVYVIARWLFKLIQDVVLGW